MHVTINSNFRLLVRCLSVNYGIERKPTTKYRLRLIKILSVNYLKAQEKQCIVILAKMMESTFRLHEMYVTF